MTTGAILKIAATPCGAKQNLLAGAADIPSDVDAHSAETGQWATALGDRRDYVSLSQPRSVLVEQPSAFVYENRARLLLRQMELAHRVDASIRTVSALELRPETFRLANGPANRIPQGQGPHR